ncbi:hypothetical protein [Leifsonia shinshuensis]|uniref:Uncharacterized protein n=1 Tax=Leifsonia shinshuensis TaxID=150026 RepID=A0A7G6YBJ6_9MICO|nr:hypothetical protein [Leifsonia shinshuensis]QNE35861.1 hypothetical protein F1C12_12485 [Leifsonia shinshuensis]
MSPAYDRDDMPDMTTVRTDAIRDALMTQVRSEPDQRRLRFRRRFAIWGSVGILVVGGLATAATAVVSAQHVTNRDGVYCFASAERGANGEYDMSGATMYDPDAGGGRVENALELCRTMWRQGVFNTDHDPLAASNAPGQVPAQLQVCVMSDGTAAVVPGRPGVCQAVGLAPEKTD